MGHGRKHTAVHAGLSGAEVIADEVGRSNASLVYVLAGNHQLVVGLPGGRLYRQGPGDRPAGGGGVPQPGEQPPGQ